ncbi:MAG: dihydroorotase [Candidatus Micrarchaeota archaeon]|nr:dihydroorotase [Candidatus Micrarchaeota archaeon]MDE1847914.1 dihydroorotase [Candidatus Micrarchaeota archaeon]MDE1864964.1 dihydroorotase [Candidatus Micrarchaeota archaeon]
MARQKSEIVFAGNALVNGEIQRVEIGVSAGKIVEIGKNIRCDKIREVNGIITPTMSDNHCHMRVPGASHKEDIRHGTMCAAYGGVTWIIHMPNTVPPTDNYDAFTEKMAMINSRSYVDSGIAVTVGERIDKRLLERATIYKLYMSETTGVNPRNVDSLIENAKRISEKKVVFVHAEDKNLIDTETPATNLMEHLGNRPERAEESAIMRLYQLGMLKAHITHFSAPGAFPWIQAGGYTVDVTPHHLFLNALSDIGAYGKVNPALKTQPTQSRLWELFRQGKINMVASDHAPHTIEEKRDFKTAPSGLPNLETTLPLFMAKWVSGEISLDRIQQALMENPAALIGIKKGKLQVGYDADFAFFELSQMRQIGAEDLHYKCGWTPYTGMYGLFPYEVVMRGNTIMSEGRMQIEPGYGKFVRN